MYAVAGEAIAKISGVPIETMVIDLLLKWKNFGFTVVGI